MDRRDMYSGVAMMNSTQQKIRKDRKLSIVLRQAECDTKHCSGVESVLLVPGYKILFTASRDSTIKRWNVAGPQPWWEASFDGHTDWVNDIVLYNDILMSCSNDKTVKIWRGTSQGNVLSTLTHHTDYVTSLASTTNSNLVASAGLGGELFLFDIETTSTIKKLYPKDCTTVIPTRKGGGYNQQRSPGGMDIQEGMDEDGSGRGSGTHSVGLSMGSTRISRGELKKSSIFSLAMSASGNVLAAGGADHIVRLWDPRSGDKVGKLRGHTDTVRALALNENGTRALTGGSDGTVKLWDVGLMRCVQTYSIHTESVWSLLPTEGFSSVYSGGRDGAVYCTNLSTRSADLVALERRPVLGMVLDGGDGSLWVCTEGSSVSKWPAAGSRAQARESSRHTPDLDRAVAASPGVNLARMSPGLRMRQHSMEVRRQSTPVAKPLMSIPGVPAITSFKVLNDRRHILSKDSEGNVELWDVLSGGVVQSYGKVVLEEKEKELFEPRSVPSWFTLDARLGQISIWLEPPSCFLSEEYALDLGYPDAPEDQKINMGRLVLEGILAKWKYHLILEDVQRTGVQQVSNQELPSSSSANSNTPAQQGKDMCTSVVQPPFTYSEPWPKYWEQTAGFRVPPAVVCSYASGAPWRLLAPSFTGKELDPDVLPSWVVEAVIRGTNVIPKESKLAFILVPEEGSDMPTLMQSKLNAPRILQVHKVASYCLTKLQELNIHLDLKPQYLKRTAYATPLPPEALSSPPAATSDSIAMKTANSVGGNGQSNTTAGGSVISLTKGHVLELLCNGMAVPYEMSLASVKKYIWRKSDDLVFTFRVQDPHAPMPLPVLSGP
ncbi:hypothetical protein CEUSTIGMA_g2715.t1 [Chlamydomonas eustigma]|uniref:Uncharacterized protein n=1 Tax=Chlamydomonas eustigma TaxID=1157962 RepID=A0A250WXL1_9CHLO|nr:hypothetical protein CEUSTIGMA_g2715.t1 [Chlamydomonas eustigma]|eukprot:GAX75270.1 hypothetical protein CEUSTIGMA_g2715.t1 [Chlamydomonas eustigma]